MSPGEERLSKVSPGDRSSPAHSVTHSHNRKVLTPSLPWYHLKTTSKSAKIETHKPFLFLFRIGMWKDFHQNASRFSGCIIGPENTYCFWGAAVQPGNFTGWGSEGVNVSPYGPTKMRRRPRVWFERITSWHFPLLAVTSSKAESRFPCRWLDSKLHSYLLIQPRRVQWQSSHTCWQEIHAVGL